MAVIPPHHMPSFVPPSITIRPMLVIGLIILNFRVTIPPSSSFLAQEFRECMTTLSLAPDLPDACSPTA